MGRRGWVGPSLAFFLLCLALGLLESGANCTASSEIRFWPPIGLTLGACLAFGNRACLGTFLGLFGILYWQMMKQTPQATAGDRAIFATLFSLGYLVQSAITKRLIHRWLSAECRVLTYQHALIYMVLAGPVHTLLVPWCGAALQCLNGQTPWEQYGPTGFRWWWTDAFSSVLFCTLVLALIGRPGETWAERRWSVGVPLLIALSVVFLGCFLAKQHDARSAFKKLEEESRIAQLRTQERIERNIDAAMRSWYLILENGGQLRSLKARETIWSHLNSLRTLSPELANVGYVPLVAQANRESFEEDMTRGAAERFEIKDRLPGLQTFRRAADRPQYAPVAIQGMRQNPFPTHGFDLLTDPYRGPALRQALEVRQPVSTGVVQAIGPDYQAEINIVFCPMINGYDKSPEHPLVQGHAEPSSVLMLIFDLKKVPASLDIIPQGLRISLIPPDIDRVRSTGSAIVVLPIQFANRTANLYVEADRGFLEKHRDNNSYLLAVSGYSLVVLLVLLLLGLTGQTHLKQNEVCSQMAALKQEVSARELTEAWLRRSEARLSQAQAIARLGYWEWDSALDQIYCSDQFCKLLEESPPLELTFQQLLQRIHPDDRSTFAERVQNFDSLRGAEHLEVRLLQASGGEVWVACVIVQTGNEIGPSLRGTVHDITPSKQAKLALAASEAHLAEAQEIARLGSWEWEPLQNACHWSDGLYTILKLDRKQSAAVVPFNASWIHPGDRDRLANARLQLLSTRQTCQVEFRAILADQSLVHLSLEAHVTSRRGEAIERVHGILQDISDRKVTEENRRKFEERVQEIQRLESLGILAGGVAHDFNNLLTGILGNAMLAAELLPPDSELHEFLRPIETSAQHAAELCQQLLTYAGKGDVARGLVSLNTLIEESAELLRLSTPKTVSLQLDLASDLFPIEGDRGQLRQLLMNLVQNAAEAIGPNGGQIVIHTEVEFSSTTFSREPQFVVLQVTDSGCGMDEVTQQRIFEPFFSTKFAGRGIGLSAVHGILVKHRGTCEVKSAVGVGSRFRIRFPLAGAEELPKTPTVSTTGLSTHDETAHTVPHVVTLGLSGTLQAIVKTSLQSIGLESVDLARLGELATEEILLNINEQVVLLIWEWDGDSALARAVWKRLAQMNPRAAVIAVISNEGYAPPASLPGQRLSVILPPIHAAEFALLIKQLLGNEVTEPG